jgi:hypothetical protein
MSFDYFCRREFKEYFQSGRYQIKIKILMRKAIFLVACLSLLSFSPEKLVKTKMTDEITALVPKNFKPMDDIDFSQRYPSVRKPLAAYTNEAREVDFSVNISATQWPDGDIEIAKEFFKLYIHRSMPAC